MKEDSIVLVWFVIEFRMVYLSKWSSSGRLQDAGREYPWLYLKLLWNIVGQTAYEFPHDPTQNPSGQNTPLAITSSKETVHTSEWTSPNPRGRYPRDTFTHCCRCDDAFQVLQVLRVDLPSHYNLRATKIVVEAALGDVWHWLLGVVELNLLQERGGDLVVKILRWKETEKWVGCTWSNCPMCTALTERTAGDKTWSPNGKRHFPCPMECRHL